MFYLKYLPEEPTPADTITVSDIDAEKGIEVELTATEDIVTKMMVKWRLSWADLSDQPKDKAEKTIILRHNVAKYGTQEQEYDFYIYNQPDIVYKCATFWLIRKSNTWKRIKFKTFLNKLNLETFDAVTLDFASPYVANGPVLAIVEKANYNSADNCVDFECLVPVLAGTMEKYHFYWPAALPQTDTWPPANEIAAGHAGGGGIGAGATGSLPVGDTATIPGGQHRLRGRPERRLPVAERLGRPHADRRRLHGPARGGSGDLHQSFARLTAALEPADLSSAKPAGHHAQRHDGQPDYGRPEQDQDSRHVGPAKRRPPICPRSSRASSRTARP